MNSKKIMENAVKVESYSVHDLDDAVKLLGDYKAQKKNVYYEFNGHKLYSMLDDVDSCYQKVVGMSKKDFEVRQARLHKEMEEKRAAEEKKAEEKIPEWIERGKKFIYPQQEEMWKYCVDVRAHDLYHGNDLENALNIMECLDNGGTIEEANKILDDENHSGTSYGITLSIVLSFSKRGPEFYRAVRGENISERQMKELEKIEKENADYERELTEAENE